MRKPARRGFPQPRALGASKLSVQVAAVCYRVRGAELEFLLVNTTSGKWTFPKGRTDPGLSGSECAAREALEEAGAKGRIEEHHFGSYVDTKRTLTHDNRSREILVAAYLMEVQDTVAPEESDRNPTWFSPEEASQRLADQRVPKYAGQLAKIVDLAVERVTARHLRQWLREPHTAHPAISN